MSELKQDLAGLLAVLKSGNIAGAGEFIGKCSTAFATGDRAVALAGCALILALCPADSFAAAANELCELGEYALAERFISDARVRFADNIDIGIAQARVAHLAGDFVLAAQRYRALRLARPELADLYLGEANNLGGAGLLDEAVGLLVDAVFRFPRDLPIAVTLATFLQTRGPADAAMRGWARVCDRFPLWPGGYLAAAKLHRGMGEFDTAESLLAGALEKFPTDFIVSAEYAWLAKIRGHLPDAKNRWQQTRLAFPDQANGYLHEAQIDFELGNADAAESLLSEAIARFPDNVTLFTEWASLAGKCNRWIDADDRWRHMRERFPENIAGYVNGLRVLRKLERLSDAAALAQVASESFAGNKDLQDEIRQLDKDRLERTKTDFILMRESTSDDPAGYVGLMETLIELGQFEAVSAVAADAQARFPDRTDVYTLEARAAEAAGDLQRASIIWRDTSRKFPHDHEPSRQYLRLLITLGDFATAETHSSDTCERFPRSVWAFRDHAELAAARHHWAEAARRWTDFGARFGDNVGERLHDLRIQQLDYEVEVAQQAGGDLSALLNYHSDSDSSSDEDERRTVMMTFESLGGLVTGCEFGAVQRAFGAEPLGLLRWTGMSMETIMEMLERRFKDIGSQATTEIGYYDLGARKEYSIKDKTFGFIGHTHVFEDQVDKKTVFNQVTKRMTFLTRKLLDDLTRREKIFLFKNTLREPYPDEIERLHTAMRSYGQNLLLLVTSADEQNPNGTLKTLRNNLWLGYVDFSGEYGEERAQHWLELCRAAYFRFRPTT